MKIVVEIPDKFVSMAKAYLMSSCDSEEQELEISEASDHLKEAEEPILLNFDKLDGELKIQLRQMLFWLAMIAVSLEVLKKPNSKDLAKGN